MTTFRYMLDTNIISDMVRNPEGAAAGRATAVPTDELCTSAIVASELRYGLRKKGAVSLARRVEAVDDRRGGLANHTRPESGQ